MFSIKKDYQERLQPEYFHDDPNSSLIYQPAIYELAIFKSLERNSKAIFDIGCGSGLKLITYVSQQYGSTRPWPSLIGIDYKNNISMARSLHPGHVWLERDLEKPILLELPNLMEKSVIIISDVIEHLIDPSNLLYFINDMIYNYDALIYISTPDRDLTWGAEHNGPPPNPCHVREWNVQEFKILLDSFGIPLLQTRYIQSRTDQPHRHTMVFICGL